MRTAVITAFCLSLVAVGAAQEAATPPAGLTVEEHTIDLGEVKAGTVAEAVFQFHNPTDREVKILSAKPS